MSVPGGQGDGVTLNAANIRRSVLDAEEEYRLACGVVGEDEARQHRDEILTKWLTNLGALPSGQGDGGRRTGLTGTARPMTRCYICGKDVTGPPGRYSNWLHTWRRRCPAGHNIKTTLADLERAASKKEGGIDGD